MLGTILSKTLRDERRRLIGWAIGLGIFVLYAIAAYPSIRKSAPSLDSLFEQMPAALKALFGGSLADMTSPAGYLQTEFFSFMVPLLLIGYAVAVGARTIAGEERRGVLELVLAAPLPRWRIVLEKLIGMMASTVLLGVWLWLCLAIGTRVIDMDVSLGRLAAAVASATLLALTFGVLALALGAFRGRRGLAFGAAGTVAVASYLVNALAPLAGWLMPYRVASPFYYYMAADPLHNGLDVGHALTLAGLVAVFAAAALVAFERRDLAA